MRKQLKLPTIEHPQAKEVGQLEKEKENMFKLIIKKNVQIQKMEADMEILLKEREQHLSFTVVIPIVTPSTAGTSTVGTSTKAAITVETHSND